MEFGFYRAPSLNYAALRRSRSASVRRSCALRKASGRDAAPDFTAIKRDDIRRHFDRNFLDRRARHGDSLELRAL